VATINGTDATDVLDGTATADWIYGRRGDDRLSGAAGNDRLFGDDGDDWLEGGNGNDRLTGGKGDDAFIGGAGDDTFDGNSGVEDHDWVGYDEERGTQGVSVNLATGFAIDSYGNADTLIDIEEVSGTEFNDVLTGGNPQNDNWESFYGARGADTINGGSGFDAVTYVFDYFSGGEMGIVLNWGAGTVRDGFGDIDRISSVEMVTGTIYSDAMTGNSQDNRFDPRFGNDVISGGNGFDLVSYRGDVAFAQRNGFSARGIVADMADGLIYDVRGYADWISSIEDIMGSALGDEIRGNGSANYLDGYLDDDVLAGRGGNDTIFGDHGHDRIYGGAGNDLLIGSTGDDVLRGGAGTDTFMIELICDTDRIRDYQKGIDRIDVSAFGFASGAAVLALAVQQGSDVVIELSADSFIEFVGTAKSGISAADFLV
jgi:Ca2+-binding RTX toxin-like protein